MCARRLSKLASVERKRDMFADIIGDDVAPKQRASTSTTTTTNAADEPEVDAQVDDEAETEKKAKKKLKKAVKEESAKRDKRRLADDAEAGGDVAKAKKKARH